MNTCLGGYMTSERRRLKTEDAKKLENKTLDSLKKLTAYNKSDSPALSQTFSLLFSIQDLIKSKSTDSYFETVERDKSHRVTFLTTESLTSEDWDGAPLELVEECRKNWKKYKDMLVTTK